VNEPVRGKVLRLTGFGAFIELAEGVEGLCHFSEVPGWSGRKTDAPPLTPGQEFEFRVIRMNELERKIGLSMRAHAEAEERSRLDEYQKRAATIASDLAKTDPEQFEVGRK
jgi:small subunit ribosomal protein S1